MKIEKTYQAILDESFRSRFPEWDSLTPLDPMKSFTEALSCSLAEVERRQTRLSDILINSLPAFFGMERKRAEPQQYFFQLKDAQSLRTVHNLSQGTEFSLAFGSKQISATLEGAMDLYPVDNFTFLREERSVTVRFSLRGGCTQVRLFIQAKDSDGSSNYVETAKLAVVQQDGARSTYEDGELTIDDGSFGGTQTGYLVVKPAPGYPLLPQKAADYELVIQFAAPFTGEEILFNVAPLALRLITPKLKLGNVQGEPWEQVALPSELIDIPREVKLNILNQEIELHRIEIDILKIRSSEPDRFQRSFFYEPYSHSLIFPGAHLLTSGVQGGVALTLTDTTSRIPAELNLKDARFDSGALRSVIEGAAPLFESRPFIERENGLDYLKRFYSAVRLFTASQSFTPGILKEDLQNELRGAHSWIRAIELDVQASEKHIDVYVLTHTSQETAETHLPDSVVEAIGEKLSRRVPLDYQYQILPFRKVALDVRTEFVASLPSQRQGVVPADLIERRINERIELLLAPERFAQGTTLPKATLAKQIENSLLEATADHTHLLPSEVDRIEMLVRRHDHGVYLETISRSTGELFCLARETTVELLTAQIGEMAARRDRRAYV